MKQFLQFIYIIFISIFLVACNDKEEDDSYLYTLIPDENFENALIFYGIDSEEILDGRVLTSDAEKAERLIFADRNGYYIADYLTGIDAFINLKELIIIDCKEEIIDLSKNNKLEYLDVSSNKFLQKIILGDNNNLIAFYINSNPLLSELNVSKNLNIYTLDTKFCPSLTCIKIIEGQAIANFRHDANQYLSTTCN